MSSLKTIEKAQLEELFEMGGGYVLDLSNPRFAEIFRDIGGIDIFAAKYSFNGDSKAKRLRAFWGVEADVTVAVILSELLEYWHFRNPEPDPQRAALAKIAERIIERFSGKIFNPKESEKSFLDLDLQNVSLCRVPIESSLLPILESRYIEAVRCLNGDAPLATVLLCGSILEGLLFGMANANPRKFNQALTSPKDDDGKVRQFQNWKLVQFIDVACELGFIALDVKKFSHSMRDFRNYVHPYE